MMVEDQASSPTNHKYLGDLHRHDSNPITMHPLALRHLSSSETKRGLKYIPDVILGKAKCTYISIIHTT